MHRTDRRPVVARGSLALAAACSAGAALVASGDASAQVWLQDRALTQGSGIRVGNVELHPGVGAEVGYDSNTTYAPFGQPTAPSLRLRFTPSISLQTLGAQRTGTPDRNSTPPVVNFSLNAAVVPVVFIPLPTTSTVNVANGTNVGGNLGLNLHVLPQRPWQFILREDFARAIQGSLDVGVSLYSFNRIENSASAEIAYQSPGEVLEWRLGYTNRIAIMTDATIAGQSRFNRMDNEIGTRLRWRFFPKTSLLFDASITPTFYLNPGASALGLFTGFPVRTRIGLNGLLTERLALQFLIGYAGSYLSAGDNVDTVIGQAELKYIFGPLTSFRFGVTRDVNVSLIGGFFIRNMAYLGVNQSFAGRFYLSADVSGGLYQYGYFADATGASSGRVTGSGFWVDSMTGRFNSVRIDGRVFGEVRATNWLGFNLTSSVTTNLTDAVLVASSSGVSISWVKFEAFLGVRANW